MTVTTGQRRVVAATSSIDEAERTASARMIPMRLEQLDRRVPFRWRSTLVDLGPVAVTLMEYGGAFSATSEGSWSESFAMSLPLGALGGETTFEGTTHTFARGRSTYLCTPGASATFRPESHYRGAHVTFRAGDVSATLGALLGATLEAPLRFDPRVSLDRGVGATLDRAVRFVLAESVTDGLVSSKTAAHRFGEALLVKLLEGQRHTYSERLAKIERAAESPSVRVAAEYLEANLARSIRITELAAVAGVSVRALQIGFQKHYGVSPAELLRERRLSAARARLLERRSDTSVAEIARGCGFTHLGRFSAHYRRRFGELPLETRSRGR